MTSAPDPHADQLADRYGRRTGRRLPVTLIVALVVGTPFLAWLAWVVWTYSTPAVQSELESFEFPDAHTASAVVQVTLADDATDVLCRVRAMSTDKVAVGEKPFVPVDGRNEVTWRTERAATSVTLVGCTADGQPRPR